MLMVVFGAGASYDSVPQFSATRFTAMPQRPPLANQLFDERFAGVLTMYPRLHPIVPYLQAAGVSVETELEKLSGDVSAYPGRLPQLFAIRYYLQHMIKQTCDGWHNMSGGRTNYRTLFDQIRHLVKPKSPVGLVTFNYDLLIEQSLALEGIKFATLADYANNSEFPLFKLHGSVNWVRELDYPNVINLDRSAWELVKQLLDSAGRLQLSNRYAINGDIPATRSESMAALPAIAIPMQGKAEFECPPEHLGLLRQLLPNIKKALLVGWRGGEKHFLKLIRESVRQPLKVLTVAKDVVEANQTNAQLQSEGIQGEYLTSSGPFTEFVVQRQGEAFFKD
jgi:hypothetical protein